MNIDKCGFCPSCKAFVTDSGTFSSCPQCGYVLYHLAHCDVCKVTVVAAKCDDDYQVAEVVCHECLRPALVKEEAKRLREITREQHIKPVRDLWYAQGADKVWHAYEIVPHSSCQPGFVELEALCPNGGTIHNCVLPEDEREIDRIIGPRRLNCPDCARAIDWSSWPFRSRGNCAR